jgi:anti-anti-sigma factor
MERGTDERGSGGAVEALDALRAQWALNRRAREREPAVASAFDDPEAVAPGVMLLSPRGAIDAFTAAELGAAIDALRSSGVEQLIVDLSAASLIDSCGLGTLLTAHLTLRSNGGLLALVAGPPDVMRGLHVTGLDHVLAVFATAEDALRSFE